MHIKSAQKMQDVALYYTKNIKTTETKHFHASKIRFFIVLGVLGQFTIEDIQFNTKIALQRYNVDL